MDVWMRGIFLFSQLSGESDGILRRHIHLSEDMGRDVDSHGPALVLKDISVFFPYA